MQEFSERILAHREFLSMTTFIACVRRIMEVGLFTQAGKEQDVETHLVSSGDQLLHFFLVLLSVPSVYLFVCVCVCVCVCRSALQIC